MRIFRSATTKTRSVHFKNRASPRPHPVNKMASKITFASEVNTGFHSSVCIPKLRQSLLVHFFKCSHESEDVSSDSDVCSSVFPDKFSREDSLDMLYEESHSAQDNLRNI